MNKTKFKKGSVFILILIMGYFLWIILKPFDYTVSLKLKTLPGTINQTIKFWSNLSKNSEIIEQNSMNELKQQIKYQDTTLVFNWKITPINDSLSKVYIGVKDSSHSLSNRFSGLFKETNFEKRVKSEVMNYFNLVDGHLQTIKIKVVGEEEVPSMFCAYVSVKSKQFKKAKGMMQNYSLLNNVLFSNKIELNGNPFIEVTHWDMKTDSIYYNFCYPVVKKDTLLNHPLIKFKEFKKTKALKAIYNGNYMTSDRAWYALLNDAEKKGIKVKKTPIEIFFNNPSMGGNELNWKAEVYMPLKN